VGLHQGVTEQVPGLQDPSLTRNKEERLGGVGHHGCGAVHYTLHRPSMYCCGMHMLDGWCTLHLVKKVE